VGFGLVLGGAVGNLGDRWFRGHHGAVVDYITLSHWPTFNVADAGITIGVVVVALSLALRPVGRAVPSRQPEEPADSVGAGR
jgi:signal peptidase II